MKPERNVIEADYGYHKQSLCDVACAHTCAVHRRLEIECDCRHCAVEDNVRNNEHLRIFVRENIFDSVEYACLISLCLLLLLFEGFFSLSFFV